MGRREACVAVLTVAAVVAGSDGWAQTPPPGRPVILSVTVRPDTGTLVVSGRGLGPDLLVDVDGQTVTTLPGATATQLEVQAPESLLTTPGTYRLTVVDPVRRGWDGFIVASAPVAAPVPVAVEGPAAAAMTGGEAPDRAGPTPSAPPRTATPTSPVPLTVIEDSASPYRTAVGYQALAANTAAGIWNSGLGYRALDQNTTGGGNTAVGANAQGANTTGNYNTAVGSSALFSNVIGSYNVAVGSNALVNATGSQNVGVGNSALYQATASSRNVAVGNLALVDSTADDNTAVGDHAGSNVTTGRNNIHIGANVNGTTADDATIRIGNGQTATFIAGIRGTTVTAGEGVYVDSSGRLGSGPVVPGLNTVNSSHVMADSLTAADLAPGAVGSSEIADATVSAVDLAANAVGTSELADNAVTAAKVAFNYAGSASEGGPASDLACAGCVAASEVGFTFAGLGANTFAGTQTIGGGNVDLPASSATAGNLTKNGVRFLHDTGTQNVFLGWTSANFTLSGADSTGLGNQSLKNLTSGSNNTGVGSTTLWGTTSGADNTAAGYRALFDTTTGSRNTAVGSRAGYDNTTGSDNIYLGANVRGTATDANLMRLGLPFNPTTGEGQNKVFVAGIAGTVLTTPAVQVFIDANGQLGTLVPPPITGTIDGPLSANPRPDAAVQQALAEQRAIIAELRARVAALEARVAARPSRH